MYEKRHIDLVVLSDIHLGTHGCRAEELINYLRTIRPKKIILNGDIIDILYEANFTKNEKILQLVFLNIF